MRLSQILSEEQGYTEDLTDTIQDIVVRLMTQDKNSVDTGEFLHMLAKEGYVVTTDELISILGKPDMMNFISSVDSNEIAFSNQLGNNIDTAPEMGVDIGAMAGDQAMADVNSELPQ